jgi:hypothetical protein
LNQLHLHADKAGRHAFDVGQLGDVTGFSRGDLLVPTTCASNGFEDGLAAGVGGDV